MMIAKAFKIKLPKMKIPRPHIPKAPMPRVKTAPMTMRGKMAVENFKPKPMMKDISWQ